MGHPHIERLLGDKESIAYHQFQYTPLYFAIVKNDYHKVKLLLDEGANEEGISMWDINGVGGRKAITPLRLAEKIGNQNIVKLLIEHGFKDSWSASRWFSCDSDDSSTVSLDDIEDYQDLIVDSSDSD
ncbi:ankyrin repeat domain-containing protein [Candidatus Sodalis endolongispinus]|uniref:Ankyrin repeat domain-containing protein n=1 Tax=Candidatus Sodalis endolongispinus TaxID=2812662 RepID=A0ABS5Y9K8_9GAMM|nr:ankyrin repeat domain-containing protein [Candidatus Sodalis endolongispinus]MBT9431690.1 ankyrin repeat domain-containing protein [Candidatus Sodalis endolongispinus]